MYYIVELIDAHWTAYTFTVYADSLPDALQQGLEAARASGNGYLANVGAAMAGVYPERTHGYRIRIHRVGRLPVVITNERYFRNDRMLPGQAPYTEAETRQLEQLVSDAAEGDPGEADEPRRED